MYALIQIVKPVLIHELVAVFPFFATYSLAVQLKDAVLHGTGSDTEFTILETLKLILMEVIQISEDQAELLKERTAAAAERAAASQDRNASAIERQAILSSLDRMLQLLSNMTTSPVAGNSDPGVKELQILVHHSQQLSQVDNAALANQCKPQDMGCGPNQEIKFCSAAEDGLAAADVDEDGIIASEFKFPTASEVGGQCSTICRIILHACNKGIVRVHHDAVDPLKLESVNSESTSRLVYSQRSSVWTHTMHTWPEKSIDVHSDAMESEIPVDVPYQQSAHAKQASTMSICHFSQ